MLIRDLQTTYPYIQSEIDKQQTETISKKEITLIVN